MVNNKLLSMISFGTNQPILNWFSVKSINSIWWNKLTYNFPKWLFN